MSESQSHRNGMAKLLTDADPDTPLEDIVAEKQKFEYRECGWQAELQRNECIVCDYDQPLDHHGLNVDGGDG